MNKWQVQWVIRVVFPHYVFIYVSYVLTEKKILEMSDIAKI